MPAASIRLVGAVAVTLLAWCRRRGVAGVPVLFAVAPLSGERAADTVGRGLLAEFRALSIASQILFWSALTAVGALLLRRRVDERLAEIESRIGG